MFSRKQYVNTLLDTLHYIVSVWLLTNVTATATITHDVCMLTEKRSSIPTVFSVSNVENITAIFCGILQFMITGGVAYQENRQYSVRYGYANRQEYTMIMVIIT